MTILLVMCNDFIIYYLFIYLLLFCGAFSRFGVFFNKKIENVCFFQQKKKIPFAKSKDLKGRKHLDCNYLNQLN
jgi:hypothetical protein